MTVTINTLYAQIMPAHIKKVKLTRKPLRYFISQMSKIAEYDFIVPQLKLAMKMLYNCYKSVSQADF